MIIGDVFINIRPMTPPYAIRHLIIDIQGDFAYSIYEMTTGESYFLEFRQEGAFSDGWQKL